MKFLLGLALGFALAVALFFAPLSIARPAVGDKVSPELEKTLDDVNYQWLCSGKYYKPKAQDCVNFRAQYWADQFFEIYPSGLVQTKAEMIARQRAAHPSKDVGPHPSEFKLMAVYPNFALATDHTWLRSEDVNGKEAGTDTRVLRMFVKENGKWRPAGAALVPIVK